MDAFQYMLNCGQLDHAIMEKFVIENNAPGASSFAQSQTTPSNTLRDNVLCFKGIMFGERPALDLTMRTTQSVLRNIMPHCTVDDVMAIPSFLQAIIDNTSADSFCYKNENYHMFMGKHNEFEAYTHTEKSTAFETDPQAVKTKIQSALEQVKDKISDAARQAIEETKTQLDSIIANGLQKLHAGHYFVPLDYNDLQQPNILTLSDKTYQIVDSAEAISDAIRKGSSSLPVAFGAMAEVTPGGDILSVSIVIRDDKETLTYDVTKCTSREFQCICQYMQEAVNNYRRENYGNAFYYDTIEQEPRIIPPHFIAPRGIYLGHEPDVKLPKFTSAREIYAFIDQVYDSNRETPGAGEYDNETPGDID